MMSNDNISCKKATVLMSKSMEQELSLQEKASLAAHLAICKTCCFCQKQLNTIRTTIAHYSEAVFHHPVSDDCRLTDEAKERIKSRLNQDTD